MRCRFLKDEIIFPYRDKKYQYCSIENPPNTKVRVKDSWKEKYCENALVDEAYLQCPIYKRYMKDFQQRIAIAESASPKTGKRKKTRAK